MDNRPALREGDVVKLSKKGRDYPRQFPKGSTLVVSSVNGDGIDRSSIITCRIEISNGFQQYKFYRSELWFTGVNAFTGTKDVPNINDGRDTCYKCGKPIYRGGTYAICNNIDCEWYKKWF